MSMTVIPVAAAVLQRDGRFLLTQRLPGKQFAEQWEFPGGKLEAGETLQQALERELMEEISLTTRAGEVLHVCQNGGYMIVFLRAEVCGGELCCMEAQDARFVTLEEARELNMTPQDRAAMEEMHRLGRLL